MFSDKSEKNAQVEVFYFSGSLDILNSRVCKLCIYFPFSLPNKSFECPKSGASGRCISINYEVHENNLSMIICKVDWGNNLRIII